MQFTIQPSAVQSGHVGQLRNMFAQEWGQIDSFDGLVHGKAIPRPLVALDVHGHLLGGLAFTAYKHPSTADRALWINAVFVVASHRRNGIATGLIQVAGAASKDLGFESLFVYTDVWSLYERLAWRVISSSGQHRVLLSTL